MGLEFVNLECCSLDPFIGEEFLSSPEGHMCDSDSFGRELTLLCLGSVWKGSVVLTNIPFFLCMLMSGVRYAEGYV